jgi:hypothetical protein
MGYLCADCRGGYCRLPNGGFYMAPDDEWLFHIVNPVSGFEGDLSADGSGVAACCFADQIGFCRPVSSIAGIHFSTCGRL